MDYSTIKVLLNIKIIMEPGPFVIIDQRITNLEEANIIKDFLDGTDDYELSELINDDIHSRIDADQDFKLSTMTCNVTKEYQNIYFFEQLFTEGNVSFDVVSVIKKHLEKK